MSCMLTCWIFSSLHADPGKLFQELKAELVSKFDANGDGRLDAQERLKMRTETIKGKAKQKGGRSRGMIPPELLEAFDKDKDGEIGDEERQTMDKDLGGRFAKMMQTYDKNGDGNLKGEEVSRLKDAAQNGHLTGLDAFVSKWLLMQFRSMGNGSEEESGDKFKFDRDGDGLASADELEAIRNQKKKP